MILSSEVECLLTHSGRIPSTFAWQDLSKEIFLPGSNRSTWFIMTVRDTIGWSTQEALRPTPNCKTQCTNQVWPWRIQNLEWLWKMTLSRCWVTNLIPAMKACSKSEEWPPVDRPSLEEGSQEAQAIPLSGAMTVYRTRTGASLVRVRTAGTPRETTQRTKIKLKMIILTI